MLIKSFFKGSKVEIANKNKSIEYPDHIVKLDENEFTSFVEKYKFSLVDFYAPWCKPCMKMHPRLRQLTKYNYKKMAFARINIQDNENISKEYNITGIPHFIIFKNGKKLYSFSGIKTIRELEKIIKYIITKYA
jgi:thioredoxin 1